MILKYFLCKNIFALCKIALYNKCMKGVDSMPEITRFYGIVIKIFFRNEHNPPHIHAIYGEHVGVIDIQTGKMIEGDLPQRAIKLIQEWIKKYRIDLMEIWESQNFKKIPPLK